MIKCVTSFVISENFPRADCDNIFERGKKNFAVDILHSLCRTFFYGWHNQIALRIVKSQKNNNSSKNSSSSSLYRRFERINLNFSFFPFLYELLRRVCEHSLFHAMGVRAGVRPTNAFVSDVLQLKNRFCSRLPRLSRMHISFGFVLTRI